MTSTELTLTATPQAIGTGNVLQAIIYVDKGGSGQLRLTADNELVAIVGRERFILAGPNGRAIDAGDWSMTGSGRAVIFLQEAPSEPIPPSPFAYSSKVTFGEMLNGAFENLFIADALQYTLKGQLSAQTVRVSVEDQQIIVGDGLTQSQGIQRTAMALIADLPEGWGVGDTIQYAGTNYRTVEIIDQDEYSVTFALSKQPK